MSTGKITITIPCDICGEYKETMNEVWEQKNRSVTISGCGQFCEKCLISFIQWGVELYKEHLK